MRQQVAEARAHPHHRIRHGEEVSGRRQPARHRTDREGAEGTQRQEDEDVAREACERLRRRGDARERLVLEELAVRRRGAEDAAGVDGGEDERERDEEHDVDLLLHRQRRRTSKEAEDEGDEQVDRPVRVEPPPRPHHFEEVAAAAHPQLHRPARGRRRHRHLLHRRRRPRRPAPPLVVAPVASELRRRDVFVRADETERYLDEEVGGVVHRRQREPVATKVVQHLRAQPAVRQLPGAQQQHAIDQREGRRPRLVHAGDDDAAALGDRVQDGDHH